MTYIMLNIVTTSLCVILPINYCAGKCYTCFILGFLRNKYRDSSRRDIINELHFFQRTTYMGEPQTYYDRQEKACRYSNDFLSDIGDGMASDKTRVLSFSDQYEFKPALKQHVSNFIMACILSFTLLLLLLAARIVVAWPSS